MSSVKLLKHTPQHASTAAAVVRC